MAAPAPWPDHSTRRNASRPSPLGNLKETRPHHEFNFTPKHGSSPNLVEGFFSKLARSVPRHIRVTSKQELKDRIMAAMDHFNQDPVPGERDPARLRVHAIVEP